jgi:tryptophanyl-tRNA synthetase
LPIQEKRREFEANPEKVDEILRDHAEKCREIAQTTVKEVRDKMGFLQIGSR